VKCKLIKQAVIIFFIVSWVATSLPSSFADTEAPIITLQAERCVISETWAHIYWETNEPAIGGIEWGLTNQYGNSAKESGTYTTQHFINITDLTRDTNYNVLIFATDPSNNTGYFSFILGSYPSGLETTIDYFIIIAAVVIIVLFLIITVILIYRRKQKR